VREAAQYAPPLYAARCDPAAAHTRLSACGAQRALLLVAIGAMNIHDVRDRQTSDRQSDRRQADVRRETASSLNTPAIRGGA